MEETKKDKESFQVTALKLRSQQMEFIASNIANADTPNYQAVDIDFKTALQQRYLHPRGRRISQQYYATYVGSTNFVGPCFYRTLLPHGGAYRSDDARRRQ